MKMDEIRQLSVDDLKLHLEDLLEEMENLRIQHSTHQLDNPMRIRDVRREIAAVRTVLHEYELGIRKQE
ncbi:50S ribosomal protein L29 [candidate division KSB1 bacterium]|jgi:large subunit ribosomal protein L29|nr:50S ribosomal protein L29 [candidate division KSB1 bacterium]